MNLLCKLAKCILDHYDNKEGKTVIDIPYVVNKKVERMANEGELLNIIEDNIEQSINKALHDAMNSWDIKKTLEKKMKAEIGGSIEGISFSQYGAKVTDAILNIVEKLTDVDFREKVEKEYQSFFNADSSDITGDELAEAYAEYLNNEFEYDEKYELDGKYYCTCEIDNTNWIKMIFAPSHKDTRDSKAYTVFFMRCKEDKALPEDEEQFYKVSFMGAGSSHTNLLKAFAFKDHRYSRFEKLLINCYLNERKVKLEPGDYDCYADIDY